MAFDLHVFTDRNGQMCIVMTDSNNKKSARYTPNKFHRGVILALKQVIELYDWRKKL